MLGTINGFIWKYGYPPNISHNINKRTDDEPVDLYRVAKAYSVQLSQISHVPGSPHYMDPNECDVFHDGLTNQLKLYVRTIKITEKKHQQTKHMVFN